MCHERMNLILAERILERRHSPLTVGNDLSELCIGELLDYRRAKVRNVHAPSDLRATSVLTVVNVPAFTQRWSRSSPMPNSPKSFSDGNGGMRSFKNFSQRGSGSFSRSAHSLAAWKKIVRPRYNALPHEQSGRFFEK